MIHLYSDTLSPHCHRVLALLNEAAIPYQVHAIDLETGEQLSESFRAINPNLQVPSLQDGDIQLHESNAILRYICRKHQLDQWYPQDLAALAKVEQWLDWNQCRLAPLMATIIMNRLFLGEQADLPAADRAESQLHALLPILEQGVSHADYLAGDHPTIADLSIASNLKLLAFGNVFPESTLVRHWYDKVASLKGFRTSQHHA